jgi:CRP-like cAMP-binding protein
MSINAQSFFFDGKELLPQSLASGNELLKNLLRTPALRSQLLPELRVVSLEVNQVLYEQGDKIDFVYFPLDSVISSLAIMEDGITVETAMVGREGLEGMSAILGSGKSRQWNWVLVKGSAVQLDARLLDRVLIQNEDALKAFLKCYRLLVSQVTQRCVCNTRHTILERLSAWLLMLHDRVGGENLRLTQEVIASRLGARRAGITVAAGLLQAMHAIEYKRGQLHIRDREVLEQAVCECYQLMRSEFEEMPPPVIPLFRYK